jgi:hypothetical protein
MDLNDLANNPDQIKQLISVLQQLLPKETPSEELSTQEEEEFSNTAIKTKNSKKRPKQSVNKFLEMTEKDMHKDDTRIDKILSKHPPVMRSREFEPIEVRCRVCGNTETVNPSIVENKSRYKCNKCSTSAG